MNLSYCAACFTGSSRPVLQLQWTKCLRFPKSHMLRPNSPCDGIWSGGHLGGDEATWKTHERIRAFVKREGDTGFLFLFSTISGGSTCQPGRWPQNLPAL